MFSRAHVLTKLTNEGGASSVSVTSLFCDVTVKSLFGDVTEFTDFTVVTLALEDKESELEVRLNLLNAVLTGLFSSDELFC